MGRSRSEEPIDISLRIWSEQMPLASIAERLGFAVEQVSRRGEPIQSNGRALKIVAQRHYASLAHRQATDAVETAEWCRTVMQRVSADQELEALLHGGLAEATVWVAILRPIKDSPLRLPADVVAHARRLNLTLFVEDYTAEGPESPSKVWLTEPSRLVRSAV